MIQEEPGRIAYAAMERRILRSNFTPPSTMLPEVWCEQIRRMPGGTRFRWKYAPYERDMFRSIFDKTVRETVFEVFSRGGKSEVILNALGICIIEQPRRILVLWPTNGHGEIWSKDVLTGELLQTTDQLNAVLGNKQGRRMSNNTLLFKQFPGGSVTIFGANAPGDMRRAKGNFLYADEIDAISETVTDEGDQLLIFGKRGDEYLDTIRVFASYPSVKGKSRIRNKLEKSDWQLWNVICPRCGGEPFVMDRTMLRYDPDKTQDASLECPRCSALLVDADRYAMMLAGKWQATRPFNGIRGFHANSLLWPHKVDPAKYPGGYLQVLALKEIAVRESENTERALHVLVNTDDADPYEPPHSKKPEASDLVKRREPWIPSKLIPDGVLYVVGGADVQADRIEVEFVGFGLNQETWGLGYYVLSGSTDGPHPWKALETLLEKTGWETENGRTLGCEALGIDSNWRPDTVRAFCRKNASKKVWAFIGSRQLGVPVIGKPSKLGRPPTWVWSIGTHEVKDRIFQWLSKSPEIFEGKTTYPHGYLHYPAIDFYGEKYFRSLTVENSEMRRASDGEFYRWFECPEGERNEALDSRVYSFAAAQNLNRDVSALAARAATFQRGKPVEKKVVQAPQQRRGGFVGASGFRI